MLGTAGHVDHGKTALVKLLTGCETDTLAEEKERGLTIDLGFAPCRLADNRVVGIIDVPGHIDFIRNMVAGAHGIDIAIFVVAADDGIMPQTYEHLHILTLMGVKHGLIALTKIDLVDAERRGTVIANLRAMLSGTFLAEAPLCPISNITGEGFEAFFEALNRIVDRCGARPTSGLFRMWVEDVFTVRGTGTVVTGIPTNGRVRIGDSLLLVPAGEEVRARRMQVYGAEAGEAAAGECVAMNLPELNHLEVRRGMLLASKEVPQPISMVEAELLVLSSLRGDLEDYIETHVHVGTASTLGHVALLEDDRLTRGKSHLVQIRLVEPVPLIPGERFVVRANLRSAGQTGLTTIGGGRILGISNTRLRRKKQWTLELLAKRRAVLDDSAAWCELMLHERAEPLSLEGLVRACVRCPDELTPLLSSLATAGRIVRLPDGRYLHQRHVVDTAQRVTKILKTFHEVNPQRAGMSQEELFATSAVPAAYGALALQAALDSRQIQRVGAVFALAGWSPRQSTGEQALVDRVGNLYARAGWATPSFADAVAQLGLTPLQVEKAVKTLVERAELVALDPRTHIHRDALEGAKKVVLELFTKQPRFTTMDFRDALGVSRKYAVPLLDYLDRLRFTVRSGHDRTPGVEARKLLASK
jgi:selenocysteine-specific elongation factor